MTACKTIGRAITHPAKWVPVRMWATYYPITIENIELRSESG